MLSASREPMRQFLYTMLASVHRDSFSRDSLPVCLWKENPNRLVSLLDIVKQFNAFALAACYQALLATSDQCDAIGATSGGGTPVPTGLRDQAYSIIGSVSSFCQQHGFSDARDRIERVVIGLGTLRSEEMDVSTLKAKLEQVKDALLAALHDHKFLRIESERSRYLDAPYLLGERVVIAFKSAIPDIVDAGNCLALELHTAAVFHLMRVAEHGLRVLGRTVGVKLKDKGKNQLIEFAEWDKIITAIKNRISKARALSQGPKRSARLSFYSEGADHCLYLKELRNELSHARKGYNPGEALGVLERVRGFMAFLERGL